jgi:AcrR family transcriptional regulator
MSFSSASTEQIKEQILQQATESFARHGFDGAKIGQIANACGISNGAVLHHFKNKKQLQRETFFHVLASIILTPDNETLDLDDLLADVAERILDRCRSDPGSLRFLLQTFLSNPEQTEYFYNNEVVNDLRNHLINRIEHGKSAGELKNVDSSFAATSFLGMVIYIAMTSEFFESDEIGRMSSKEAALKITSLFLDGIMAG